MKRNPIFRRDELINARSLTLPLLVTLLNGGLSILILINLFYIVSTAELTGEIAYQSFLRRHWPRHPLPVSGTSVDWGF